MKTNKILYTAFFSAVILLSSCAGFYYKKANKAYDRWQYTDAISYYEKALAKEDFPGSREKLAYAYLKINNIQLAEKNYRNAISLNELSMNGHLNFASVLLERGKYEEASKYVKIYLTQNPSDLFAQMIFTSCNSVHDKYRDTTLYSLNKIETGELLNVFGTASYEDGIIITADKPVFSGRKSNPWTGNSYLDLYYMEKDASGKWMSPTLLQGDINGKFHEGPATFSSDGNTAYFTRSSYLNNRKLDKNNDKISNLKIYKSILNGDKWSEPELLPFNSDDYSCGHPSLSKDGKTLYFVSDMAGGNGGTDIYKSEFNGSNWSNPENLGNVVNSGGNEMFPYMHEDGTLYFSSNGHNSLGGLDVYMTTLHIDHWARPENLNYPLNTKFDDFSYTLTEDKTIGFVTSTRADGNDKLYSFKKNKPAFILYGKARKKGTQDAVEGVRVEITEADTKKVISKITDKEGKFEMKLEPEKEYLLYCTKLGCFTKTDNISTKDKTYSENFYADFEVEEIIINKPIVLENIFYDFDKWEIRADAALELDKLVKVLNDNPTITIELSSHTDWRGSDQYNLVLSDKRAKAAVDYIISKGIPAERITAKGYGETQPVNKCTNFVECSEEEYQINRRTEFKVTKITPEIK
jgi:peptidoglycan-associated lipoprotein